MSRNKLSEYIKLAAAAVRAAYGDFTGLAMEGVKYACPENHRHRLCHRSDSHHPAGLLYSIPKNDDNLKDNVIEIYQNNLELLENMLCTYAGHVYYYDEIPVPASYESISRVYDPSKGMNVLEASIKVKTGTIKKDSGKRIFEDIDIYTTVKQTIYSSNDVVNFKVDDGRIKIKYRKFGLAAFFPIPEEYASSFTNDFGNARHHDGKPASHEGNDIFAKRNTPVISIENCMIRKIGWNSFGGWRLLLESKDGLRTYYYAHLENYSENIQKYKDSTGKVYENPGIEVKAGEIIGYVGSSSIAAKES